MSTATNENDHIQESVNQPAEKHEETIEEEEEEVPFEELYENAKRNFALKRWAEAVDGFGQALESLRDKHAEDDPILAPLHHRYGHALLEHAIATSGALGGGGGGKDAPLPSRSGGGGGAATTVASARAEENKAASSSKAASSINAAVKTPADPRFTFGGDAEESDDDEAEGKPEGGEEEEGDDLGDAFAVLELARVQYEKLIENNSSFTTIEGEQWNTLKIKSQLAEVLNDLADVGLESENFQQSSSDYKLALELLEPLLLPFSRRLADANLRLGLALEFHPDPAMQASAETYVQAACIVLRKRLDALQKRQAILHSQREGVTEELSSKVKEDVEREQAEKVHDEKVAELEKEGVLNNGKGKANDDQSETESKTLEKDDIVTMDWQILTKEMADMKEMIQELELKLEEFANAPPGTGAVGTSSGSVEGGSIAADTKAALQQAINEAFLGASTNGLANSAFGSSSSKVSDPNVQVNDLSSMVRKKKKAPETTTNGTEDSNGKRKAVDESIVSNNDGSKRTRVEDASSQ